MVIVTDVSSLDDQDPEDINKQHMRGMELLRSILQVNTSCTPPRPPSPADVRAEVTGQAPVCLRGSRQRHA